MVHSPSKRWEDGVLVERAIATDEPTDPNESEGTTAKPYKTPVSTTRSPEERAAQTKAVEEAENKAVASTETKRARKTKK